MGKVEVLPMGDRPLRFVVMYVRWEGKWLFVRHRERDTWECAGGHIESGENPWEAARRELYEEAGVAEGNLIPVTDFHGGDPEKPGRVFLALAHQVVDLPDFEMAQRALFDQPPPDMTYPRIHDELFPIVNKYWRNLYETV